MAGQTKITRRFATAAVAAVAVAVALTAGTFQRDLGNQAAERVSSAVTSAAAAAPLASDSRS